MRSRVCNESATIFLWVSEFWALCRIPKHVGSVLLVSDDISTRNTRSDEAELWYCFMLRMWSREGGYFQRLVSIWCVWKRGRHLPQLSFIPFLKDKRHFVMHQVAPFHRIRTVEILEVWAKNFTQVDKSELQGKLFCHRCTSKEPGSLLAVSSQQWLQLGVPWAITCFLKNASGPAFLTVSDCVLFSFASISLLLLSQAHL